MRSTSTAIASPRAARGRQVAVQQVDLDVVVLGDADRRADEDRADQQVARDLLGPRGRVVEDVAREELVEDRRRRGARTAPARPSPRSCVPDRSTASSVAWNSPSSPITLGRHRCPSRPPPRAGRGAFRAAPAAASIASSRLLDGDDAVVVLACRSPSTRRSWSSAPRRRSSCRSTVCTPRPFFLNSSTSSPSRFLIVALARAAASWLTSVKIFFSASVSLFQTCGATCVVSAVDDVAGQHDVLLHLVELLRLDRRQRVLLRVDGAVLQRQVDLGEGDRRRVRAAGLGRARGRPARRARGSSGPSCRRSR